ncbi:MAG: GNAT family N-acetyltransferase [Candidatus Competibacterales bacterium]|nr:GNAT family N-acetyltransferase [Candidatus Competibacterales bacterium]
MSPIPLSGFSVQTADWRRDEAELYAIRRRVFVEEQQVPESLERDKHDPRSQHVIARDRQGRAIGTGRLLPDGHIGRVAVLPEWRGHGVGIALMEVLLTLARERGLDLIRLNAQTAVIPFYQRLGFNPEGAEFMEAGIPHRSMWLHLTDRSPT